MALISETPDKLSKANPEPLINAAKVKIVGGMSEHALEDPPALGESRTYIVKAFCKEHHTKVIDGEERLVVDMEQTSIYERGRVPIVDEQPALFGESEAEKEAKTAEVEIAAENAAESEHGMVGGTDPDVEMRDEEESADVEPIDPPEAESQGKPSIFSDNEV